MALNRFYRPDSAATSQLLGDLAEHLASVGHDVTVICSRLLYEGGGVLPKREVIAGVSVRRVSSTRFGRANLLGRAIDYVTFYISSFAAVLAIGRRGDLLIIKTDPPLLCIPATLAARLRGMRTVNWCQDIFPEVAARLGHRWARGWLGKILQALRNRSLKRAAFNAVLHEKMAEHLVAEGVPIDRLVLLPNWADRNIRPVPHETNALRAAWGLEGRFVIGYSGNLGRAHMPEAVARLVEATRDVEGLTWLFIGGGAGHAALRRAADRAGNVVFKPYQPLERLSESLSIPDLHLIALDPACEGVIVPSKLYGARAVNRPVLFIGDREGATGRDIARYGGGWILSPDGVPASVDLVRRLVGQHLLGRMTVEDEDWGAGWSASNALDAWLQAISPQAQDSARMEGVGAEQVSAA